MARKKKHAEHVNHERWLVSYADFITLLFAFFVVMFAVSQVDSKKVGRFQDSFTMAVGVNSGEKGYLPTKEDLTTPIEASMMPLPPPQAEEVGDHKNSKPMFPEQLAEVEKDLAERLAIDKMLAGLSVIRRGNELVLRMDATALFDSGTDRVKDVAMPLLIAVANEIRDKQVMIRVEGHTDAQPIKTLRYRSNWDLSTARATSVVAVMAEQGHIDPRRLMAAGYAEFQPLGSNDTTEGRAMNRRVDFVLSVTLVRAKWTGTEADQPERALEEVNSSEGPAYHPAPAEEPAPAPTAAAAPADEHGEHAAPAEEHAPAGHH